MNNCTINTQTQQNTDIIMQYMAWMWMVFQLKRNNTKNARFIEKKKLKQKIEIYKKKRTRHKLCHVVIFIVFLKPLSKWLSQTQWTNIRNVLIKLFRICFFPILMRKINSISKYVLDHVHRVRIIIGRLPGNIDFLFLFQNLRFDCNINVSVLASF